MNGSGIDSRPMTGMVPDTTSAMRRTSSPGVIAPEFSIQCRVVACLPPPTIES